MFVSSLKIKEKLYYFCNISKCYVFTIKDHPNTKIINSHKMESISAPTLQTCYLIP